MEAAALSTLQVCIRRPTPAKLCEICANPKAKQRLTRLKAPLNALIRATQVEPRNRRYANVVVAIVVVADRA